MTMSWRHLFTLAAISGAQPGDAVAFANSVLRAVGVTETHEYAADLQRLVSCFVGAVAPLGMC